MTRHLFPPCSLGEMAERLKASALKAEVGKTTVGSNPTLTALVTAHTTLTNPQAWLLKTSGKVRKDAELPRCCAIQTIYRQWSKAVGLLVDPNTSQDLRS